MKWFIAAATVLSVSATLTAMLMDGYLVPANLVSKLVTALTPTPRRLFLFDPAILSHYHSVDEIIQDFPDDIKRRSVLILNSKSNQESSPPEPRVYLFSEEAKQIAAFNHGNSIEFMTFSEETKRFTLREIEFQGNTPRLSGLNPPKCLECHSSNPKPLLDQDALAGDTSGATNKESLKNQKGRYQILLQRSSDANAVFTELILKLVTKSRN